MICWVCHGGERLAFELMVKYDQGIEWREYTDQPGQ